MFLIIKLISLTIARNTVYAKPAKTAHLLNRKLISLEQNVFVTSQENARVCNNSS